MRSGVAAVGGMGVARVAGSSADLSSIESRLRRGSGVGW